jgi:hypothetical protein
MVAPLAVWIALLVLLACVVAGLALVVVRAISLWRLTKRTGRTFGAELEKIARAADEIDGQLARASAAADRLRAAQDRLAASRARLDVQLAAVREAQAQVGRVLWFLPGR